MAQRPRNPEHLTPAEAALWRRVVETVRAAPGRVAPVVTAAPVKAPGRQVVKAAPLPAVPARPKKPAPAKPGDTLDGNWDRQLERGVVSPDRIIDLHGDTLDRAYGRIDSALSEAVAAGDRVILLVTGKPGGVRPGSGRGAIRAVVGDWLAASRHAGRIAAVRPAHRRHGGAGALYLILRRR